MRIAIINKTAGGMSEGYRKYLKNVVSRMAYHPDVSALLVGLPAKKDISEWRKAFPSVSWISIKSNPLSFFGLERQSEKKIVMFSPSVVFIPTSRFFKINSIPTVTMLQNMEPLIWRGENPLFEKIINHLRKKIAYSSSVKANRIIAVSHFVKEFIEKKWKIDPKKIAVIYHGIGFLEDEATHRPISIPPSWEGEFLFTAGSIRPARGLEDVIHALRYLPEESHVRGLAIAGEAHPHMIGYQNKLKLLIENNNLSSRVRWTGKLNDAEMRWCYQHCKIFVMTSRAEACPNIALEAMANGSIIISTRNPPMPEFFAKTAIYYPERDVKALAEKIQHTFTWDKTTLNQISKAAKHRANEFSWNACVEKTLAELKKATEISDVYNHSR